MIWKDRVAAAWKKGLGLALILMDRPGIRPALCVARAALSAADDAEEVD